MVLNRLIAAVVAIAMSAGIAHAVISGIKSDSQDQQVAMGQMQLGSGTSTGTITPTINAGAGFITTTSRSEAAGASFNVTMTNSRVAVGDQVQCTVDPQSSTGQPICVYAKVTAGQVVFLIKNIDASAALNNTIGVYFWINKAGNPN